MNAPQRLALAAAVCAAAYGCAVPVCSGEGRQPLSIVPSSLTAGQGLFFDVSLQAPISVPFDVFCFAMTTYGRFSLYLDGSVSYEIQPVCENVWGREFPFAARVRPRVTIPTDMRGMNITFYLFITPAGKRPIFTFLEELGPNTANIVFFDSVKLPVR
jgi:hypothetical protein